MPRSSQFPRETDLLNPGSANATTASLKIDLWYRQQQIWERWTWQRFVRLALFLNLTAEELASVVGLPHNQLAKFQQENHAYVGRSPARAEALLLTILEAHCMKHLTEDVIEHPFPAL